MISHRNRILFCALRLFVTFGVTQGYIYPSSQGFRYVNGKRNEGLISESSGLLTNLLQLIRDIKISSKIEDANSFDNVEDKEFWYRIQLFPKANQGWDDIDSYMDTDHPMDPIKVKRRCLSSTKQGCYPVYRHNNDLLSECLLCATN